MSEKIDARVTSIFLWPIKSGCLNISTSCSEFQLEQLPKMNEKPQAPLPLWLTLVIGAVAGLLVLTLWYFWPALVFKISVVGQAAKDPDSGVLSRAGQFGDTYGALTSLFTAITTIGLIITLLYQRYQVIEARRSTGYARQAAAAAEKQMALAEQAFKAEHALRLSEETQRKAERETEHKTRLEETAERQFFQLLPLMQGHVSQFTRTPFSGMAALQNFCHIGLARAEEILGQRADPSKAWPEMRARVMQDVGDHWAYLRPFFGSLELIVTILTRGDLANGRYLADALVANLGHDILTYALLHGCAAKENQGALLPWGEFVTLTAFEPQYGKTVFERIVKPRL